MSRVTFNNKNKFFFNSINAEVEHYFRKNNLKKTGNNTLYVKSIILIGIAVAIYIMLLVVQLNPIMAVLLCCVLGFVQATIGFNVMHDANHGSYSEKKWINTTMGLTANVMGVNAGLWKQKHNIIHHTYTNIDGVDIDMNKAPILRMCTSQKQLKAHRYQYLYCIPLYAFTTLLMIFVSEFVNYFKKKILVTKLNKMNAHEHFIFWFSKCFYIFSFLAVPIFTVGLIPTLIGFIVMHLTMGVALAVVFQLAHAVEATHVVEASKIDFRIEDEWAVHQVITTADFATDNKIVSWFTGGLNFQVVHHLFPKISHVHYPAIHQIVKNACVEFSVRYNHYPSMTSAIRSHLRFMKQLGVQKTVL